MGKHILIVDDDALLRRSLAFNLEKAGYSASTASTAEEALKIIQYQRPNLVLLDIGLPGMDGLDAVKQIKDNFNLPVIFLTARRRELDEVLGLELGADDYVTKPFDFDVLAAHIKAVIRRTERVNSESKTITPITIGDIYIDPAGYIVMVAGRKVELSPREFRLLFILANSPNQVITVDDLLSLVWGAEFIGQPQVVYVHIRWLREKIEHDPSHPKYILTVRGIGYKLVVPEE
jgi:DNA-binding response OmpR family regulator